MPNPPVEELIAAALPGRRVRRVERIGRDHGVFSVVHRVVLDGAGDGPASVVVKVPDEGPNGEAAAASGAYRREAIAYRAVLPACGVAAPRCLLVAEDGDRASFVLQDLSQLRLVDQLAGLGPAEAAAVVDQLAVLHRRWQQAPELDRLGVRRSTPASFDVAALRRGVEVVAHRWEPVVGVPLAPTFGRLVARVGPLVEAFSAAGPVTLCHGDPRADNVAFDAGGGAVLFDWQQLGRNLAQADLAWLAATSLEPEVRRAEEADLVRRHARAVGHDPAGAARRYRLGMLLPGLAVLLLAQRQLATERAERLVATSLRRIAAAVDDLELAALAA